MTGPERRTVQVRRSPRIGVFLALGAVLGAVAALVVVVVSPGDPQVPAPQAFGFFVLFLAPMGALLAGFVAVLLDAASARRTRTLEAERDAWSPPPERLNDGDLGAEAPETDP